MLTDMQIPIVPVSDGTTQRLIANIQENTVANKNYYTGEQFILNGVLYEVTKTGSPAIAQGATIDIANDCVVSPTITQQMGINDASLLLPDSIRIEPSSLIYGTSINHGTFYYKIGTRVHVNIAISGIGSVSGAVSLFILPAGYRPSNLIVYNGYAGSHSAVSEQIKGFINANGNVTYDTTGGNTGTVYASVEFDAFA